ncbi:DUF6916 family protein [uncultured Erythrobacter sp.]|uniref:DUF6916 family protein n=1 Tax=uncultured Erythrobacter sp. TaxID=263913 RepID=UPI00265AA939|nr:hypothetical protein [uncultured Erythrobacter sp.]
MDTPAALTLADFADFQGARFSMQVESGSLELELEKVEPLRLSARPGSSFRLAFRGPRKPLYPQGTYRLESSGLAVEIFLVPIAQDDAGTLYEAIFN